MMRTKWAYFLLLMLAVAGCKKENDRAFDQSPDERVNAVLNKYQTLLETAENGWRGVVITDSGKGLPFGFYFKFSNTNRVVMYSDFTNTSATTSKESSYRLKALQQVSLLFDTYSYIHVLADPDPAVAGGALGSGFGVDFEFYFDHSTNDSIYMVGRKHGNRALLVRATKAEADAYAAGGMNKSMSFEQHFTGDIFQYWKTVSIGGVNYQLNIDPNTRQISITWVDGSGVAHTFTTGYYFTADGVAFVDALVNNGITIAGFSNITWNATPKTISVTVNGTTSTIAGVNVPAYVDPAAPSNWYGQAIAADTYWYSVYGFHINGVDRAFNVTSITGTAANPYYYYFIYWPGYATGNDLFAPIFLNAAQTGLSLLYGSAPRKPTANNARYIFQEIGGYGTYPTTGPANDMRAQFYNASGYYFVKTGDDSYDMVSVADSKNWITWYQAQ
jgi:hypothetical protein